MFIFEYVDMLVDWQRNQITTRRPLALTVLAAPGDDINKYNPDGPNFSEIYRLPNIAAGTRCYYIARREISQKFELDPGIVAMWRNPWKGL